MRLYDPEESEPVEPILRLKLPNTFNPLPRQESHIDPETVDQMREAGLTEAQIQEQIDFIVASRYFKCSYLVTFSDSNKKLSP